MFRMKIISPKLDEIAKDKHMDSGDFLKSFMKNLMILQQFDQKNVSYQFFISL